MKSRVATAFAVPFLVAGCASGAPTASESSTPPSATSAPASAMSSAMSSIPAQSAETESFPPWLTSAPASSYLSESSAATDVSLPADGEYVCVSKELAICRDQGGEATAIALTSGEDTDQTPTSGVTDFDPTLSVTAPLGTHIMILDVGKDVAKPAPLVVPSNVTGAELPDAFDGYQLLAWSTDDKSLYYFAGPTRALRVLTFGADGQPLTSKVRCRPMRRFPNSAGDGSCPTSTSTRRAGSCSSTPYR
jgi:hypothetical protein